MKRRIRIHNFTAWRTRDLRAFVVRCANQCFDDDEKPLIVVRFERGRATGSRRLEGWASGCAYIGGNSCTIRLIDDACDRHDLAFVLHHEMAHMRGMTHADMRGGSLFRRIGDYAKHFEWAAELPLERKPIRKKKKPTVEDKVEHLETLRARWLTKQKRAATAIRKLDQRLRRMRRAAINAGGAQ